MWVFHSHFRDPNEERERPRVRWRDLARVARYFRPHLAPLLLTLACIAATAVLGVVPPLLIRALIDDAIPQGDGGLLNLLVLGMIAVPLVSGLIGVAQNYLNTLVGQRVMLHLRDDLYRHLLGQMSLRFFTQTRTGEIMSRLTSDVAGVQSVVTGTLLGTITNVITLLTTLAVILSLDWRLSLLSIAILPLFIYPTRRVGQIRHRLAVETQKKNADLTSLMQETLNISGFLLVRSFAREVAEFLRFRQKNQELMDLQVRQSLVGRWFFMSLGLFTAAGPALIYWYGGHQAITGALSIGTIVAFVAFLGRLYGPVSALANIHVDVMAGMAYFGRVFQYLDMPPEIAEHPAALVLPPVRGHVRFQAVSFGYVPGRLALDGVSFEVQPGQLAALVGPSGAGKTTITYLLPRFYDPTAGAIAVDGHDIRDVTLLSLRDQIGMVTQETFLFHTTIRENVRYGRPGAGDEEIEQACRAANIHEFIVGLPAGYETVVGERGYRLSGGEKQRVAIARVLLKDPRILILDEATASLDSRAETLIQAALASLRQGRTSLVIAHRLSTILAADVIFVLDQARLVEQGTHAELLARGGLYARLYHEQFKARAHPAGDGPVERGARARLLAGGEDPWIPSDPK
ncbi:MAG: ABC transporter ATP-binding protein [Chloroflexi bacterium]|nr:ABC transporter ATP-binding protein [Chloroflexota bacterium]